MKLELISVSPEEFKKVVTEGERVPPGGGACEAGGEAADAKDARIAELEAELKAARETIADKQAWIERAAEDDNGQPDAAESEVKQ